MTLQKLFDNVIFITLFSWWTAVVFVVGAMFSLAKQ